MPCPRPRRSSRSRSRSAAGYRLAAHGGAGTCAAAARCIARHRALDHLRRNQRRPALPVPADDLAAWPATGDGADTAQRALDTVATQNAIALIATLPPDQAEAVLLRAVVGLDA